MAILDQDRSPLLDPGEDGLQTTADDHDGSRALSNGNANGATTSSEIKTTGASTSASPQTKVYARRWYVLFIFCLLNVAQNLGWNTWGPVSDSATLVFGWSGAEIGLFATIGNLSYGLTVFGACYVMDVLGLRTAALAMTTMLTVGAGIRCITSHKVIQFWMSAVSALLSGVAGTVTFSGSALFSSVWFPASQRATATAMVNTFNFLGVSLSFILGPAFVNYVNPCVNQSTIAPALYSQPEPHFPTILGNEDEADMGLPCNISNNYTEAVIDKQRTEIMTYLYVEAGIMASLFLLVLVYFPSRPPLPPSISASTSRLQFRSGLWALAKNRSFWFLALAYAVPAGLFGVWGTVLNVNLRPIGVTQFQAAQIGLYYNLAGGLTGLVISRLSDLMSRHMKQILILLYVLAAASLAWIMLISAQFIPFSLPSLFVSTCLASVFLNSGVALFYELSSEMCYPVAEGIIGGFLTLINNITGVIFLTILYIPNIGTAWMNWTMFGATVLAIPLLFLVQAKYARLQIDTTQTGDTSVQDKTMQDEPTSADTRHA